MATATDAARERVLVARARLGEELVVLEASARAAVDIPAKVKASPAKAAAFAGTAGFLILGGPGRVVRGIRRVVKGPRVPMPKRMLPDEIEKTLSHMGSDGNAVRGALERDFAEYARKAAKNRIDVKRLLALAVARPLFLGGSKAVSRWLFSTDEQGFGERLAQVRGRLGEVAGQRGAAGSRATPATPTTPAKPSTGSLRDDAEDVSGA